MDEKLITSAAMAAVNDLKLDCTVASVYRRKNAWCVKFSGSYGELCDEFRGKYGEENSAEVAREKIKRHLLKTPKPTGRRKGGNARTSHPNRESSLLDLPLQIAEGALEQTARVAGEVIGRTTEVAANTLKTFADAAQTASQAATAVEPTHLSTSVRIASTESSPGRADKPRPVATKRTRKASKKPGAKSSRKNAGKK